MSRRLSGDLALVEAFVCGCKDDDCPRREVVHRVAARLADAEARAEAAALERAADDVLTEFDPPIEACIWASEWLRDRAARLRGDQ